MIPDALGAYRNGRNPYEQDGPRAFTADEIAMIHASGKASAILRVAREQLAQLPEIVVWRLLSLDDAIDALTSLIDRFDCAEVRVIAAIEEE